MLRPFSTIFRRCLPIGALVAALLGTGSQWDLLQTFAWGRMLADYSQSMSFCAAVEKTFSGDPCPVCVAVRRAKQQEAASAGSNSEQSLQKIVLFFRATMAVVCAPPSKIFWSRTWQLAGLTMDRSAPPNPPPRLLA